MERDKERKRGGERGERVKERREGRGERRAGKEFQKGETKSEGWSKKIVRGE